jgi:hypothetical protein
LGTGNWELGIGNWELGIGNWELGIRKMEKLIIEYSYNFYALTSEFHLFPKCLVAHFAPQIPNSQFPVPRYKFQIPNRTNHLKILRT